MIGARTRRLLALVLIGVTVITLAPTFDDFPVSDAFSLLLKARDLSVLEILSPQQTTYANPYYRPLFVLLLKPMEALWGPAGTAQHVLAFLVHTAGVLLVWWLGRRLLERPRAAFFGALGFALAPAAATTVAWTTVCYTVLSGVLSLGALVAAIIAIDRRSLRWAGLAFALQWLALMASQSAYQCAPTLALWILLSGAWRQPVGRFYGIALVLGLGLLTATSYLAFESSLSASTFGQKDLGILGMASLCLRNIPTYISVALSTPEVPPLVMWLALALGALGLWALAGRNGLFIGLFGLTATLPYSLIAPATDRYAYLALAPVSLAVATLIDGVGRLRFIPNFLATVALILLVARGGWLAREAIAPWEALGDEARNVDETTRSIASRLAGPEQLHLLNLPEFHKWVIAYRLGFSPDQVKWKVKWHRRLETARVAFGPLDLNLGELDLLLEFRDGQLKETQVEDRPPRLVYPFANFPTRVVLVPPNDERAALSVVDLYSGDPSEIVVLEQMPSDVSLPLSRGRLLGFGAGEGHAWADVEMEGRGLMVLILPWFPRDPVAAQVGQTGRLPDVYAVEVDDQPVHLYPAFFHFAAVVVPAGSHRVKVRHLGS